MKRELQTWRSMKQRCLNPKDQAYDRYGALGITVCAEWLSFSSFYADMGPRPQNMSLGRIDNSKGYYKENCRWETRTQQNRNRSICRPVTIEGITKNLSVWAEEYGISRRTLTNRLDKGVTAKEDLFRRVSRTIPLPASRFKTGTIVTVNGVSKNITQWAQQCGVGRTTIAQRIKNGWAVEKAVSTPRKQGRH